MVTAETYVKLTIPNHFIKGFLKQTVFNKTSKTNLIIKPHNMPQQRVLLPHLVLFPQQKGSSSWFSNKISFEGFIELEFWNQLVIIIGLLSH